MSTPLPKNQRLVLDFIAGHCGCTAAMIGLHINPNIASARSRSGSGAGIAYVLIRKGLVERRLIRRELYGYSATDAGKIIMSGFPER